MYYMSLFMKLEVRFQWPLESFWVEFPFISVEFSKCSNFSLLIIIKFFIAARCSLLNYARNHRGNAPAWYEFNKSIIKTKSILWSLRAYRKAYGEGYVFKNTLYNIDYNILFCILHCCIVIHLSHIKSFKHTIYFISWFSSCFNHSLPPSSAIVILFNGKMFGLHLFGIIILILYISHVMFGTKKTKMKINRCSTFSTFINIWHVHWLQSDSFIFACLFIHWSNNKNFISPPSS
jgi:hypothetical protein